ncbi:MAG: DUF2179 domain-containing protein [Phycisphaeraceae bacterium]|nr:DUF2179 domain-containing protein [Phycisphaeraceae bacterium]
MNAPDMPLWIPFLIFFARICDVSMATMRMILLTSGIKFWPVVIGFFEVIIWVIAVSSALRYLPNPFAVLGYASGYACGMMLGVYLEDRIAIGFRLVRVINSDQTIDLSLALRGLRWRVTRINAEGMNGPTEICFTAIRRRDVPTLRRQVSEIAPMSFMTIERIDRLAGGSYGSLAQTRTPFSRFSTRK